MIFNKNLTRMKKKFVFWKKNVNKKKMIFIIYNKKLILWKKISNFKRINFSKKIIHYK